MRAKAKKNRNSEKNRLGSFRIIAGLWRSRRLTFPESEGLRPSTDRVRETVFNWLAPYLPGAQVLDLFAGSGALGFEALSRGAAICQFVERQKPVATQLEANKNTLKASADIARTDALEWLQSNKRAFDIVFIDPPFRCNFVQKTIDLLLANDALAEGARIYVEQELEAALPVWPNGWTLLKEKEAGQVRYCLYGAGDSE